jgi:hypothetical protein
VLLGVLPVPPRWEPKTDSTGRTLADVLATASDLSCIGLVTTAEVVE